MQNKLSHSSTQRDNPIQQKVSSQVQQITTDIVLKDTELVIKKQAVSEAQNAKILARGRLIDVKKKAVEVQTKVTVLIKKSNEIQKQLQLREDELVALQALHDREKGKLQHVIDNRNEEIQKLRQDLQVIQDELASEKEKAHSVRKQLQQATQELTDKSARVQELEWARQKLETLLDSERKRVDLLLMRATSASNSQQHNREIEVISDAGTLYVFYCS